MSVWLQTKLIDLSTTANGPPRRFTIARLAPADLETVALAAAAKEHVISYVHASLVRGNWLAADLGVDASNRLAATFDVERVGLDLVASNVIWSPRTMRQLRAGEYRYATALFASELDAAGMPHPFELVSVGLTAIPVDTKNLTDPPQRSTPPKKEVTTMGIQNNDAADAAAYVQLGLGTEDEYRASVAKLRALGYVLNPKTLAWEPPGPRAKYAQSEIDEVGE